MKSEIYTIILGVLTGVLIGLVYLVFTAPLFGQTKGGARARASAGAGAESSSSVTIVIPQKEESEFDKKRAEALDICMRIYRYYGYVEVVAASDGTVVCR